MSITITNDGIFGSRRKFVQCNACLCEIHGNLAVTVNTEAGRVDLCVGCDRRGFRVEKSGSIKMVGTEDSDLSQLTTVKTIYGYPLSWFERCDIRHHPDAWIASDGHISIDGVGQATGIRMKDECRAKTNPRWTEPLNTFNKE